MKNILSSIFCFLVFTALAQTKIPFQNFSSAGTTSGAATNGTVKLYSVIGQPTALASLPRSNTQAGFMQVVDYVVIDAVAPVITYTGGSQKISKQAPPTITATITDNIPTGLVAKIHYRKIADATWSEAALLAGANNTFTATVLPSWFDAQGMEYYLEAKDATPNTTRSPTAGSYYAYITSTEESVPSDRIGFGTKTTQYKIIAIPYGESNTVTSLFEEIGDFTNDNATWRMASYNNNTDNFIEYPNFTSLSRGVGYWMLVKTTKDVKVGPVAVAAENRATLYSMILKPGWNLIGNPYPVPINWNDVRTLNNNTNVGEIKVYNSGFNNGTTVAPYEGGFVFVNGTTDVPIKIPFAGQTMEGGRTKSEFSTDLSEPNWLIKFELTQGDEVNLLGGIGMHEDASLKVDQFDDYNPPAFLKSPEINFPHPEHKLKNFCRDVLPTATEAEWSFTVTGEIGKEAILQWPADLAGNNELILYDEVNLALIDLKSVEQYSFTLTKDHSFKIYFGKDVSNNIRPKQISFASPYPNPVQNADKVTFKLALPEVAAAFTVSVDVYSNTGSLVGSHHTTLTPGIHELALPLNSQASGVYFYKVGVLSNSESKIITGKLLVL